MSPRQRRGEETRERLLAAALDLYAEKGADGFTMTAVTATSGVSVGSLYHHFGSFDGLAAALYARCLSELLDAVIAALDAVPQGQEGGPRDGTEARAAAGVRAVVTGYLGFTREHRAAARFVHASAYADFLAAHADLIAAEREPRLTWILGWLRPYVEAGLVVGLPDELIEMLVVGPVAETARRWLAGAPGIDLDEASRLLPERIWRSLRAAEAAEASVTR
ncbi:TetR/AcrR family transcriptional regulator [Streptosporangium sp. NPDC005286]|uniref:TetR/AcrR family transcriptional regulator n=1 Tax=Streptosporangium sp. NPDC005286 TaxID=3154463 RepID=UPI0033A92D0C